MKDSRFSLVTAINDLSKVAIAIETLVESNLDPEKADEILSNLAPELDVAVESFKERVDARINFLEFLSILESKIKEDVSYLQQKITSIHLLQERLKKHTVYLIEQNPGVLFEGSVKKLVVQQNGGKQPIEYKVALQGMKDLVDPTDASKFPADFIKERKVLQLEKDKFEAYLSSGGQSDAAQALPRGKHLRIR